MMRTLIFAGITAAAFTVFAAPAVEAQESGAGGGLAVVRPQAWATSGRAERRGFGLFDRRQRDDSRPVGFRALMEAQPPEGYERTVVAFRTGEPAGTIIIDSRDKFLYLVQEGGTAIRYGIGVGREGFAWAGRERISRKSKWPSWRPPAEMLERAPTLPVYMDGGIRNPLGARALYLGSTLYRIHGTNEPSTIGTAQSSGCIRMTNRDVMDLYERTRIGAPVIVLGPNSDRTILRKALASAPANEVVADAAPPPAAEPSAAEATPTGPIIRILASAPEMVSVPAPRPARAAPRPGPVAAVPTPAAPPPATASASAPPRQVSTAPIGAVERTALPAPGATATPLRSTLY